MTTTPNRKDFMAKLKQATLVFYLSVTLIGIVFFIWYQIVYPKQDPAFVGQVSNNDVGYGFTKFRLKNGYFFDSKMRGVFYTEAQMRNYLDNIFPRLVARHENDWTQQIRDIVTNEGYQWKVGFAWVIKTDPNDKEEKYDYVVFPILAKRKSSTSNEYVTLDCFDPASKGFYHHPDSKKSEEENFYNTGELWP